MARCWRSWARSANVGGVLYALVGCIGLQALPGAEGPGFAGKDSGQDSGEPIHSAEDANHEPYADAGGDQAGFVGVVLNLDGSGSYDPDGDTISYQWSIDSAPSGSNVKLSDARKDLAQLVPDKEGAWQLSLVVDDGAFESEPDTISLAVGLDNGSPIAAAGADQTVAAGATVTLNGSGSSDPDGDPMSYAWTLGTRPATSAAALSSTSAARPTFLADVAGTYEATLTVSDGTTTSAGDRVRVVAEASGGGGGGGSTSCLGCAGRGEGAFVLLAAAGLLVRGRRRRG